MARTAISQPDGVRVHPGRDHRLVVFYFLVAALLLTLVAALAWQQLLRKEIYHEREQRQGQRRVLVPGPRGRILDREGRLLAGNRARFAVTLALDELGREFSAESRIVRQNYRDAAEKEPPSNAQLDQIARTAVVRRYLDAVDALIGRQTRLDAAALQTHYREQPLLPFVLLNDLNPDEYARLVEQLPVASPLQVFASSVRDYPLGALAAHTIGHVVASGSGEPPEDFPGDNLDTFQLKDMKGLDGLEKQFDSQLRGGAGGVIVRVNPAGYRLNPPLVKVAPERGGDVVTSLDADLQAAAELALNGDGGESGYTGAAVALDVHTGEVLVLASAPGYNLQDFTPRTGQATVDDINARGAWTNRAVSGFYPPGSTFKILVSIAGLRSGAITPEQLMEEPCEGRIRVGNTWKTCDNGEGSHGALTLSGAIAESCDIYYYQAGLRITPQVIAAEARRFHLDHRPRLEIAAEFDRSLIPDPNWKQSTRHTSWFDGDTANMSIGQGDVLVSPLAMACFAASVARDEIFTQPTLLHRADAPTQQYERIGLTLAQRAVLLEGMEGCTLSTSSTRGTAYMLSTVNPISGLRIAGKTGTAQIPGKKDVAWFICFAPIENPQIAIAVAVEGDQAGETFAGGRHAAPIAQEILRKWNEKQTRAGAPAAPSLRFSLPANSTGR
jgi:penicillin-binding protein 2